MAVTANRFLKGQDIKFSSAEDAAVATQTQVHGICRKPQTAIDMAWANICTNIGLKL
jgi:hypothetical protein